MATSYMNISITRTLIVIASGIASLVLTECTSLPSRKYQKGWVSVEQVNDHLQFKHKSGSIAVADEEKYENVGVEMSLPLGLLRNNVYASNATFYYPEKQVVFIRVLNKNPPIYKDTIYSINGNAAEDFIDKYVPMLADQQELIDDKFILDRKSSIIRRQQTEIFLYNIKSKSYDIFLKNVMNINNY